MEVKVSTQTFTAHCPVITGVNLEKVHEEFMTYKESTSEEEPMASFRSFSDVTYSGRTATKKNFLNCVSLKTKRDTTRQVIDLKIFNNGVIQLAGCKEYKDALPVIRVIIRCFFYINSKDASILTFSDPSPTSADVYVVSAMRNVFFDLGFRIKRDTLRDYFISNKHTLTPPDQFERQIRIATPLTGFTGVQIYFPVKDLSTLPIHRLTFQPEESMERSDTLVPLRELWDLKPRLETQRKSKPASVSISVFQTGNALMSGIDFEYQKPIFDWFISKILEIRHLVEVTSDLTTDKGKPITFANYIHPSTSSL